MEEDSSRRGAGETLSKVATATALMEGVPAETDAGRDEDEGLRV